MTSTLTTAAEIMSQYRVSSEQIERVTIETCGATVTSQSNGPDHQVRWNARFARLSCTCKAGQEARPCWAQRATLAAIAIAHIEERELAAALASRSDEEIEEQSAIAALVGSGVSTDEAIARVYGAAGVGLTYDPAVTRDERGRILR